MEGSARQSKARQGTCIWLDVWISTRKTTNVCSAVHNRKRQDSGGKMLITERADFEVKGNEDKTDEDVECCRVDAGGVFSAGRTGGIRR